MLCRSMSFSATQRTAREVTSVSLYTTGSVAGGGLQFELVLPGHERVRGVVGHGYLAVGTGLRRSREDAGRADAGEHQYER